MPPGAARGAVWDRQEPCGIARSRQEEQEAPICINCRTVIRLKHGAARSVARSRQEHAGCARSGQGQPGASQKCQCAQFVELSYVYEHSAAGSPRGMWPAAATRQAKGVGFRVLSFYYVAEERGRSRVQPSFAGGRA